MAEVTPVQQKLFEKVARAIAPELESGEASLDDALAALIATSCALMVTAPDGTYPRFCQDLANTWILGRQRLAQEKAGAAANPPPAPR